MVKRYSFDEGDEAYYDAQGFLPEGYADLVPATDHDALAAELADWKLAAGVAASDIIERDARIRELEAQEKVATDFIVRVLEAIDIDVPKPCDVIISLETVWYQVLGHIEGLKGELTDKDARISELEAALRFWMPSVQPGFDVERWYKDRALVFGSASETPVSTLCAVCDQIKELHPSSHPWTAKETETKHED